MRGIDVIVRGCARLGVFVTEKRFTRRRGDAERLLRLIRAQPLLANSVVRRLAAFLGILIIVTLVGMLFWRVYEHHEAAEPYDMDETVVAHVKIAMPTF
jgi:hypothetical protein